MVQWFLRKASFNLGLRSKYDLDLEYSLTFINSISCLHLPTFGSQAAIVSEKATVITFSYRKAKYTKFDLAVKYVMVNTGSSFEQNMMGGSPSCLMPNFVEIGLLVPEKIFKGFLPYMDVAAILVMQSRCREQTFVPLPMDAPHKIWL